MLNDILSMKRLNDAIAGSRCIRTIGSYFPLRGGNTCVTYELKRLRNDLPLYQCKTSLVAMQRAYMKCSLRCDHPTVGQWCNLMHGYRFILSPMTLYYLIIRAGKKITKGTTAAQ